MCDFGMRISASLECGLRSSLGYFARDLLTKLHEDGVLSLSLEEAYKSLNLSELMPLRDSCDVVASLTPKGSMLLPFCGEVVSDWCLGVRYNHGLYTQCSRGRVSGGDYCVTCVRQATNSSTGQPPHGDIRERLAAGISYCSPKGKPCIPYANVASKLGLDVEKAKVVALAEFGWCIPEWELTKRTLKRGRRPKGTVVSLEKKKKKKGRPKKAVVVSLSQEDLIAKLVSEAGSEILGDGVSDVGSVSSVSSACSASSVANVSASEAAEKVVSKLVEKAARKEAKLAKKAALKAAKATLKAEKAALKAERISKKEASDASIQADKLRKFGKKVAKEAAKAGKVKLKAALLSAKASLKAEKEAASASLKAEKAAKKAEKDVLKAAQKAEKEAASASLKAEKDVLKAAKKAEKEAASASLKAEKAAQKAEKEVLKAAQKAEKEVLKAAQKAEKEVLKLVSKKVQIVSEIRKFAALNKVDVDTDDIDVSELKLILKGQKKLNRELERAEQKALEDVQAVVVTEELEEESVASVESEDEEDDELILPTKMIDGVNYLYDAGGDAYGVEHMVLTESGDPVGVWDPVSEVVTPGDYEIAE
jgi:hypothetical protein